MPDPSSHIAVLSLLCCTALTAQSSLLLPAAAGSSDLNTSVVYPFDSAAVRVQYVIAGQHLLDAGIRRAIVLQRLRARADGSAAGSWGGSSISTLRVDLSTAPHAYTSASATFDQNHGTDRTTVYQGSVAIAAVNLVTVPVRGPIYVDIQFATPFLYDPRRGDLTLDLVSSGVLNTAATVAQDASSSTGTALAKRVHNTNPAAATGTVTTGEFCGVFGLGYAEDQFVVDFWGAPLVNNIPMTVNFHDISTSLAPGGVVAWEWDFESDGVIDSTLQHPSRYFLGPCMAYTVTLRARDGWNRWRTTTKTDYIRIGVPSVALRWEPQDPPNRVLFTNDSLLLTGIWEWDFDSDGVIDSTQRDPGVFAYPQVGRIYQATLRGRLPCGTATASVNVLTARQSGTAPPPASWYWLGPDPDTVFADVEVTSPGGVFLIGASQFWPNSQGSQFMAMRLMLTEQGWNGKQNDPAAFWTAYDGVASRALDPEHLTLPMYTMLWPAWHPDGIYLPRGRYGLALQMTTPAGLSPYRVDRWDWPASGDLVVSNCKRGSLGTAATQWDDWAGRLHFVRAGDRQVAGYSLLGMGCTGPRGMPGIQALAPPLVGQDFVLRHTNLPAGVAFRILGLSASTSQFGPLPLELGLQGMPGCWLRISTDSVGLLLAAPNETFADWTLAIPNSATLIGTAFFNQALLPAPGWNQFGAVMSVACGGLVGM